MKIPTFFQAKWFTWALSSLGVLIVLLLVFQLGVLTGLHKAGFSYRWADNYHRAFGGPRGGLWHDEGQDFTSGHGISGTVIKIDGSSVVAKGSDGLEKVILVSADTAIEEGRQVIPLADLEVNDRIVVIGTPNDDGSIAAKLIRVFDQSALPLSPHRGFRWPMFGF